MRTTDRGLMWHGMLLFLIGLVTGLSERRFTNMRMALSAHLEGVMNGTFLIALGAVWGHVELPVGAVRHVWQLAVHHARRCDGYRCGQSDLVTGPSRKTMAGKGSGGGLSKRFVFDSRCRGAAPVWSWPAAINASHAPRSAR
jgi:hypothetical protein